MAYQTNLQFNSQGSCFLYLDINSCFATVEQQANPLLRHKPIAVTAYPGRNGCVLAASVDAKKLGIKTGMRLSEAKKIFPNLYTLVSDPNKYRFVHKAIKKILYDYSSLVNPKSIDEFFVDFSKHSSLPDLFLIAKEIKERIKNEIGDYLTVSIGLAPSIYLAKIASNLKKPDGLEEINKENFLEVYKKLKLTDLTGIASKIATKLNMSGIDSVVDLYLSDASKLQKAFRSILAIHWYRRLRGFDSGLFSEKTKSIGHTYTLPRDSSSHSEVETVLAKLAEKISIRLQKNNFLAHGLHLSVYYQNRQFHHKSFKTILSLYSSADIYKLALQTLNSFPSLPVRNLSLTCFLLSSSSSLQLDLFGNEDKKVKVSASLSSLKARYGSFVVFPGSMLSHQNHAPDAIGFGNIP